MFYRILCLFTCAWLWQTLTLAGHAVSETGWIVEQKSQVSGEHTIYLTDTRLKSVNKLSKITMLTCAPEWKIVILNDLSKTFFTTDIAHLKGETSGRVFTAHRLDMSEGTWFLRPPGTMFGQKTTIHYLFRNRPSSEPRRAPQVFEVAHMTGVTRATSTCLTAAPMPDMMSKLVARLYCVAPLREFPLNVIYWDQQGLETTSVFTRSLKQTKIADALFAIPKGYKQVKTEEAVYQDEASKKAWQDSFGWLGDVDKSTPNKKH